MKTLIALSIPKFSLLAFLFKKPIFIVPVVPVIAVTKLVVSFEGMCWLLFWTFLADLASGLLASYFDWKKSDHQERWFFGKGEGFSSEKAKKMVVKAIVYLGLPLILIQLQQILFLKNFKYSRLSDAEFEWATIALMGFFFIEMFSIFHENLPRCGFNLWQILKKIFGVYKDVKKELKED
ncbi:hypothetical protein B0A75_04765 [Flavobacterium oncorhynchi]|uniref:Holin n=1 Tax=Flavobacterium oncorhynchi TaxID=728056 RepID=A0A226I6I3_9FLAO|nr:phage holin family protein [Flavobacterium oncorhynchi]OXB01757.1 hypothetical protein B0A75_04765 [Flavobacterium oncorhynchi]